MGKGYWAKIWIEILEDRKVMQLPESLRWRFVECILVAKKENRGGLLPPIEDMAWLLRLNAESLSADMTRLAQPGLVELRATDEGERWFVTKFEERQAQTVDAADRTRRWRNASVTKRHTNVTQRHPEEEVEKETEIETEGEADADRAPARDDDIAFNAGQRILKRWQQLTGRTAPRDNDEWTREWFIPVNQLWARVGKDEDAVFEAMKRQRQMMLDDGKTPFRPSAVVPYVLGEMDRVAVAIDANYFEEA